MEKKIVVVDQGTGYVKCGFVGEKIPSHIFHSMVGRPMIRSDEMIDNIKLKDVMCGSECAALRSMLQISYPIVNGIIRNWEDMYHLWDYTFYERLKVDPKEYKILLTEAAMNPRENRKKMLETMFERYGFQAVHVATQALLTLYAQGLMTGVVLDSGDGVTHIIPVFQSYGLNHCIKRLDIAGRDVTKHLIELLRLRGYAFNRTADFETVGQIKEKYCYVGLDLRLEEQLASETTTLDETYELPDGRIIKIGRERFMAPECLFQPRLLDIEADGVAKQVFSCINDADVDLRKQLYSSIVLSGGTTMFPGFPTRLQKELEMLYMTKVMKMPAAEASKSHPTSIQIQIEDPPRRKYFVFSGGSVLAEVGDKDPTFWLTKKEYDEKGADYLLSKQ
ncbi:actin-related protein 2 [Monocercomonoides exilis]|uniref:actin-related protein 2 n=1 Tax=Monocercomonoides exilis TaxID=2049356 RepID=UPI00355A4789|nr:actin-related protein 2 [Monocercomonoides exilis]|eukprot:MONOS_15594.1-p1 / transcript=MONOS_15594.1 / gene=MONOS_15594 / organism=Monocercomonoides_exilis_PA203 / gene_product=actin-related protein 2 / transcript_product=actin-related protein 2 / location=Mono_scaffold01281:10099-11900(-) / protein_length=391 / sequence_SO=supercontig / SO=protein_coding / is_pseudo=false